MAELVRLVFDTNAASSDFGKIVAYVETLNLAGFGDWIDVKITDPTGIVIKDFTSVDYTYLMSPNPSLTEIFQVSIPLIGTAWMAGEYIVDIQHYDSGRDQVDEYQATFDYQPNNDSNNQNTVADFTAEVDCDNARITWTDETDNTGWTVDSRQIRAQPPTIPGQAAPAAVTTTGTSLTQSITYTNVIWSGDLNIVRTKETDEGEIYFVQTESIASLINSTINCGRGACDAVGCVAGRYEQLFSKACQLGGFTKLPQKDKDDLLHQLLLLVIADIKFSCGEGTSAQGYIDRLNAMFKDCGCGCTDTSSSNTVPTPYP